LFSSSVIVNDCVLAGMYAGLRFDELLDDVAFGTTIVSGTTTVPWLDELPPLPEPLPLPVPVPEPEPDPEPDDPTVVAGTAPPPPPPHAERTLNRASVMRTRAGMLK